MQEESIQEHTLELQCSEPGWPAMTISVPQSPDSDASIKPEDLNPRDVYRQLKRAFRKSSGEVEPVGYERNVLLEEGVLEVPFLMRKGNLGVAVYVYPQADSISAAHFAGVQDALQRLDYAPPVYFAPAALPAAQPIDVLRSFGFDLFREVESGQAPNGTYAMWWPTDDESLFCNSKTHRFLGQLYETMHGIESYVLANLLRTFSMLPPDNPDAHRVPLTTQPYILPLFGPELAPVYMVADDQRGVQFYLHADSTTRVYRERFYKHLLGYVRRERERLQEERVVFDTYPSEDENPLAYWLLAERTVQMREGQGAQMEYFGGLEALLEDNVPLTTPMAGAEPDATAPPLDDTTRAEPEAKSDRVTQVLYTIITILIVVWIVLAGIRLFDNETRRGGEPDEQVAGGSLTTIVTTDTQLADDVIAVPTALPIPEGDDPTPTVADSAPPPDTVPDPGGVPILPETVPDAPEDIDVPAAGAEADGETEVALPPETAVADGEDPAADAPPPENGVNDVAVAPEVAEGVVMRDLTMLPLAFTRPISAMSFAGRTPMILVIEGDMAKIFDLRRRGTPLRSTPATTAVLSLDGGLLASHINGISTVAITDMNTGQRLHAMPAEHQIKGMQLSADGKLLVTRGDVIRVFDVVNGNQRIVMSPEAATLSVGFGPEANLLYALEPGALVRYSLETGTELKRLAFATAGEQRQMVISPIANQAVINDGVQLLIVDLENLELLAPTPVEDGPVRDLAIAPGSELLGLLVGERRVLLWPRDQEKMIVCLAPFEAQQVAFSADGKLLALRDRQRVFVWEVQAMLNAPRP